MVALLLFGLLLDINPLGPGAPPAPSWGALDHGISLYCCWFNPQIRSTCESGVSHFILTHINTVKAALSHLEQHAGFTSQGVSFPPSLFLIYSRWLWQGQLPSLPPVLKVGHAGFLCSLHTHTLPAIQCHVQRGVGACPPRSLGVISTSRTWCTFEAEPPCGPLPFSHPAASGYSRVHIPQGSQTPYTRFAPYFT